MVVAFFILAHTGRAGERGRWTAGTMLKARTVIIMFELGTQLVKAVEWVR